MENYGKINWAVWSDWYFLNNFYDQHKYVLKVLDHFTEVIITKYTANVNGCFYSCYKQS